MSLPPRTVAPDPLTPGQTPPEVPVVPTPDMPPLPIRDPGISDPPLPVIDPANPGPDVPIPVPPPSPTM